MFTPELITAHHLARKAIIYIRQSSPHQVLTHQESLQLQYALRQRALSLGWRPEDIEVIDADLGLPGTGTHQREGFKEIAAKAALGQVGIILSYEVQRLSRNLSDWYPLLDLCGYKRCLIADRDGVYDPATPNGRLLLGLKGTISEAELYTIRSRMTAGRLNKAERGDLALRLPTGLVRDELGRVQRDPDREVQRRIELVFTTFLQRRSASKVHQFFIEQDLALPRRDPFGDMRWKRPTIFAMITILKNPAYAGAFVYGRTRRECQAASPLKKRQKSLPAEEWKIVVKDKYPAYVDWESFVRIQAMLKDNYAEYNRNYTRGIARPGKALLQGLVYCGECGHKMIVRYQGGITYICRSLHEKYRAPICQHIPADPLDAVVIEAFFQALSPIELNLFAHALAAQQAVEDRVEQARAQQLERLRYQAALAERRFSHVDPENRLVAAELEARWEAALRQLKQAEEAAAPLGPGKVSPVILTAELKAAFSRLGEKLPWLWQTEMLSQQQKKAFLRCLIDKVVVHRAARDCLQARVVWRGGETSTFQIPIVVGKVADLSGAEEMRRAIRELFAQGLGDEEIAERLTALGHRSPKHQRVIPSTVTTFRYQHRLLHRESPSAPRRLAGYLTVPQLAEALDVPRHWIYERIEKEEIQVAQDEITGRYLFPDQPATIERFRKLKDGEIDRLCF